MPVTLPKALLPPFPLTIVAAAAVTEFTAANSSTRAAGAAVLGATRAAYFLNRRLA